MAGVSSQWRYSHNYRHHVFTNVIGVDDDLGFGVLRVTRDQEWRRNHLYQPLRNMLLAIMFEWGIAMHGLHSEHDRAATDAEKSAYTRALIRKMARQAGKVMSRDRLMDLVKGEELEAFDRSIDVHVSRIRAAIEDDPAHPRRIITVRGSGYLFARTQDQA